MKYKRMATMDLTGEIDVRSPDVHRTVSYISESSAKGPSIHISKANSKHRNSYRKPKTRAIAGGPRRTL
jgi:hypothetical protein